MKKILCAILFCVLSTTAAFGQGLKKQAERDVAVLKSQNWIPTPSYRYAGVSKEEFADSVRDAVSAKNLTLGKSHAPQSSCTETGYEHMLVSEGYRAAWTGQPVMVVSSDWYNKAPERYEFKENLPIDKIAVFSIIGQPIPIVVDWQAGLVPFEHDIKQRRRTATSRRRIPQLRPTWKVTELSAMHASWCLPISITSAIRRHPYRTSCFTLSIPRRVASD